MAPDSEPLNPAPTREILTISQLNRAIASLLEQSVPALWVVGEISNFTRAASGHWYFTLKDAAAQVRAVMFRGRAQAVGFVPREGDQVEVRALATLYQARGDFQLGVELMRRAGAGDLYQRFVQLKEKLRAEGLLDESRKRALPALPRRIGVVTSLRAAALRDVLTTLARRAPQIPVVVYPSPVQGADAPAALVAALGVAARRAECDVLLLVRGGGSIEDLWAFNDEALARAVASSPIPVVCGVGHETDFSIADFVADLRAATPTAAAQAAVPDRRELAERALELARRLDRAQVRATQSREQRLDTAARLLRSPSSYWRQQSQALAAIGTRLRVAARTSLLAPRQRLARACAGLRRPDVDAARRDLAALRDRLQRAGAVVRQTREARLDALAHKLELVSPLAVLQRGYAIVRTAQGAVVRAATGVDDGERLGVQLAEGTLDVEVLARHPPRIE
jgi:exodeoxyribonuclease VII large subunit